MPAHKSSAWPLALAYGALIVYASLYPFADWRMQGISPLSFMLAPLPRYWTWFDVLANAVGYGPLGFLLALGGLRSHSRQPVVVAVAVSAGLSLLLEALQGYLPARVPSNVDWALNVAGAVAGAVVAWGLERLGALDRWSRFRDRWFDQDSRGALVLLALWPVALLFPAPVPLGLGQVLERLEAGLEMLVGDSPLLDWLPLGDADLQPLSPSAELFSVALGVLVPALLAFSIVRTMQRRAAMLGWVICLAVGATSLSFTLSYGPQHAWSWLSLPVQLGLVLGLVLGMILLTLPRRGCAAVAVLALGVGLSLINQSPTTAYFVQTLQTWEQGRFIRFHGLVQWLAWSWPYGVLVYLVARLSRREAAP